MSLLPRIDLEKFLAVTGHAENVEPIIDLIKQGAKDFYVRQAAIGILLQRAVRYVPAIATITGSSVDLHSASTREFLIRTCLLPRVTADLANALTGRSDAGILLATLHNSHCSSIGGWVTRSPINTTPCSSYFLSPGEEVSNGSRMECAGDRIGAGAPTYGEVEEAVPLFMGGHAWAPAIRLILVQAQTLLTVGRWQTLQHWIESLPESIRNTTPWLRFWLGMCQLRVDPARARLDLEPAFALFQQGDDTLGQALAATAINIDTSAP